MTIDVTDQRKTAAADTDAGRLLVVDDNEMNRDMLSRRLSRRGHDVVTAEDGHVALELIGKENFDVILLDIMMPGIDGIEVLKRLRETHDPADLPVIMATAKDASEDIVAALKLGANDYVTKPLDFQVVLARVHTQLALKRSRDALAAAHARMKHDLEAAARVQQALLPTEPPTTSGYRFAWQYRPCDELAGDSLNVFKIDDRHIGLYVLDVSGHGVPAALVSVTANHRLHQRGVGASMITDPSPDPPGHVIVSPAEVAGRLNGLYQMAANSNRYFTMVYGVLDTQEHCLRFTCAGHPGPILIRPGAEPRVLDDSSFPIGIVKESEYQERTIDLQPGDRVYLYSDGVNEEMNADREEFGRERMGAALSERSLSLNESLDALVNKVIAWRGDDRFADDISIMGVELL